VAVEESMPSVVATRGDAPIGQFLDGMQDVDHVAAQPVELPDHNRVAGADVIEKSG
jgi:hypothetical protein